MKKGITSTMYIYILNMLFISSDMQITIIIYHVYLATVSVCLLNIKLCECKKKEFYFFL